MLCVLTQCVRVASNSSSLNVLVILRKLLLFINFLDTRRNIGGAGPVAEVDLGLHDDTGKRFFFS